MILYQLEILLVSDGSLDGDGLSRTWLPMGRLIYSGFNYAMETDQSWTKTRNLNDKCQGVLLNRNFDFNFDQGSGKILQFLIGWEWNHISINLKNFLSGLFEFGIWWNFSRKWKRKQRFNQNYFRKKLWCRHLCFWIRNFRNENTLLSKHKCF